MPSIQSVPSCIGEDFETNYYFHNKATRRANQRQKRKARDIRRAEKKTLMKEMRDLSSQLSLEKAKGGNQSSVDQKAIATFEKEEARVLQGQANSSPPERHANASKTNERHQR